MANESQQNKRALLIGINDYPNFSKLHGCVNDVTAMRQLLAERFGFAEDNMVLMTDAEATQAAIRAAMAKLVSDTMSDDIVVVHFAGHGSQMTDVEGDEPDGMDETIVCYDSGRDDQPNRDITDDEINEWLRQLAELTGNITLIFDCCHSGTVTRDASGVARRSAPPDTRRPDQLPPSPLMNKATTRSTGPSGPSGWLPLSGRYTLIAGCQDREESFEYSEPGSDVSHGALSYFLMRELAGARPGTTYRDVFQPAAARVSDHAWQQHPQIEGALDREVFGVRDIQPVSTIAVSIRNDTVKLQAGAAMGVKVGSVWSIHAAGAKHADEVKPLALAEVVAVDGLNSGLKLMGDATLESDGRYQAREESQPFEADMMIRLHGPEQHTGQLKAFQEQLSNSKLLSFSSQEHSDAVVYIIERRENVAADDPVPQLGPVTKATWVAVGADGRLIMPPHAVTEDDAIHIVIENLEKISKYRSAVALRNDNAANNLKGKVTVSMDKLNGQQEWLSLDDGAVASIDDGEAIRFAISNNHDKALYVTLLEFDYMWGINELCLGERVEPGKTLALGGEEWEIELEKDFPFVKQPEEFDPVTGSGIFKVFVTRKKVDFSPLSQGGVRGTEVWENSDLDAVLRIAGGNSATRKIKKKAAPVGDEWATIDRPYQMRKNVKPGQLDPHGSRLELEHGVALKTPGTAGTVSISSDSAAPATTSGVLTEAFRSNGIERRTTLAIEKTTVRSIAAPGDGGAEVELTSPGPGFGQVVRSVDANGISRWHIREASSASRSVGGEAKNHYVIKPQPQGKTASRGVVGAALKMVVEEYVFPLLEEKLGEMIGDYFVSKWEEKNRPYSLRMFGPDDYTVERRDSFDGETWRHLAGGKALLFVHGTFSSAHGGFGGLPRSFLEESHERYEGRVFAFDHLTISKTPKANIEYLLGELQASGVDLDVDIVCHSRGGLVTRTLVEKQHTFDFEHSINVDKAVFVAAPNAGTDLADPEHMEQLLDSYTNIMTLIPDNPVTDLLEPVLAVVKQLAIGALKGLDGLQSMNANGEFQQWINQGEKTNATQYHAISAHYEATEPRFADYVKNALTDRIFRDQDNDLVVPTAGVYADNGSGYFPIQSCRKLGPEDGVAHTSFFSEPKVVAALQEWLLR